MCSTGLLSVHSLNQLAHPEQKTWLQRNRRGLNPLRTYAVPRSRRNSSSSEGVGGIFDLCRVAGMSLGGVRRPIRPVRRPQIRGQARLGAGVAISLRHRATSRFSLYLACCGPVRLLEEAHEGEGGIVDPRRVYRVRNEGIPRLTQFAALIHDGQLIPIGILEKRHPQLVIF